jgi:hypothetical protein
MNKHKKLIEKILLGKSDSNINFQELVNLLIFLGFEMRIRGSHHIFRKSGIETKLNFQKDGNNAKSYQIRQLRLLFREYQLGDDFYE